MRERLLAEIELQVASDPDAPPVVGLDEYFAGNTDEECIAPNQLGYGRPTIAEIYDHFKQIQQRDDVQCVLVSLHPDWEEANKDTKAWPAAENVHIYTTATVDEVEGWIVGMEADGAIEGWGYRVHKAAPPIKPGYKVFTVCWD
jgi:hypothetical protein